MKLYEEFRLWENLWEPDKALTEKWETFDSDWGPEKLWHSTSVSEFRAFLQNAASAGIKGLRLSIADGIYLAARASDIDHDTIVDIATDNYLIDGTEEFEWSTCGFPKIADFENDNFEGKDWDEDDLAAWKAEMDASEAADYAAVKGKEYDIIVPETGEVKTFVRDGKQHTLVADCGTFEVELYNFYSREHIAYKNGDGVAWRELQLFETSETYFALKPLIKRLYMTNT
jgi:hypothetical protein